MALPSHSEPTVEVLDASFRQVVSRGAVVRLIATPKVAANCCFGGAIRERKPAMAVEIDIGYEGDLHCSATHGPSKSTLTTDAPVDNGGRGAAFSPTDLVATALGSCMLTIMGLWAKRSGQDLNGTRVHVVKDMVADPVRRIGTLTVRVTFPPGKRISAADREKLERAAKACPVKESLHPAVNVLTDFVYAE